MQKKTGLFLVILLVTATAVSAQESTDYDGVHVYHPLSKGFVVRSWFADGYNNLVITYGVPMKFRWAPQDSPTVSTASTQTAVVLNVDAATHCCLVCANQPYHYDSHLDDCYTTQGGCQYCESHCGITGPCDPGGSGPNYMEVNQDLSYQY